MAETKQKECTDNPVGWFEIYVDDMARARRFYETVLGVKLNQMPVDGLEYWGFPMIQRGVGASGALAKMPGLKPGGVSTVIYFSVEDCADGESRVVPAGGKVHKKKFAIGSYGFISLVVDTEGNMIGLHSPK